MQRTVTPELLDTDSGSAEEVATSLSDLWRINRWFGGISCIESLLRRITQVANLRKLSVLDVGAGSGDVALQLQTRARRAGIELSITALDRAASHLISSNGVARKVAGNALALPFRDGSFDVVACSTFLHHLEPPEVVGFCNEALRVARVAVVINDLRRHPLHLALVYAGFPLFRSRLTRHDAPASVRRAYTAAELGSMLRQSKAARIEISQCYLFRAGAIAWVK